MMNLQCRNTQGRRQAIAYLLQKEAHGGTMRILAPSYKRCSAQQCPVLLSPDRERRMLRKMYLVSSDKFPPSPPSQLPLPFSALSTTLYSSSKETKEKTRSTTPLRKVG